MLAIRKTRRQDIPQLAAVYVRAYDRPQFGEAWTKKDAAAMLGFYFDHKTFLGLTAVLNGTIVGGFFSFAKPWYDGKRLGEGELFVDPDFQGRRIGTKLFFE